MLLTIDENVRINANGIVKTLLGAWKAFLGPIDKFIDTINYPICHFE